jgi:catechol 2,3-dioxygenase-like lactoylglutathione lyase family enzyme
VSATEVHNASREAVVGNVDMHLEVEIIPVSDVDRAKEFYQRLGWRLDNDVALLDGLRIVQFTPRGSDASVTFGQGLTTAAPGSAEGGLIVSDIEAAHDELAGRGIDASEIWHGPPFPVEARQPGPDPDRTSYGADLASELRRAEVGHAEHHKRKGRSHLFHRSGQEENWPAWYAAYMVAEQTGTDLPS